MNISNRPLVSFKSAKCLSQDKMEYTGLHFDGTNFNSWQFGIKLAIQSEELWGIVSPTEPQPKLLAVGLINLVNLVICFYLLNASVYWNTHSPVVLCVNRGLPH
jgi:hypothetical protein